MLEAYLEAAESGQKAGIGLFLCPFCGSGPTWSQRPASQRPRPGSPPYRPRIAFGCANAKCPFQPRTPWRPLPRTLAGFVRMTEAAVQDWNERIWPG